jgi:DNA helicase-2/ATP-dependent DNA helicase PcrA
MTASRAARYAELPVPASATAAAPVSLASVGALLHGTDRQQRCAIKHGAGPLLVLAGPGTGKTEVLTRRIAWLIAAKQARPREILALTFTDNAAAEMQARVDELVPYGQADTAIHTFHAFGDRLLREHAFELGLPGDVRLISRSEAVIVLREHLFELGLERYRPLGDPTRFLGALVELFSRARDENVTPEALRAHALDLAARAREAPESDLEALTDLAAARLELAAAYARYRELLAGRGLIDHSDQVSLALRLLRERPAVLADVQRRYRYILVDELQDTNRAQLELVFALAGERANVTAVGDADQGIYGFRGALSGNLARFAAGFPRVRQVTLRRNYRSRRPIIEAAGRLVDHNANDPAVHTTWRQVAHRRVRRPAPVRQLVFATPDEEADGIAAEIARRIEAGARAADLCVLVRSNGETEPILRSLLVRGVPAHNGARTSLFALPAVRALLAFLRVVADQSADLELYALASAQPYALDGEVLAGLLSQARRRHRSLWEVMADAAADHAHLRRLVEDVRAGIAMSAERPSGEVLYDHLRRSGLLARLARIDGSGPDLAGLRGVARFFELVRGRASLLAHDRVPFLARHLESEDEPADDPDAGPADDRVAVLTVHRAKGLEFRHVFVAGLVDGHFPVRARPPALSLPAELLGTGERSADDEHLAEERRLFYVAMTRARDELTLSWHTAGPGGRGRRRPSPFVAEALDLPVAVAPPAAGVVADDERIARMAASAAPTPGESPRPAAGGPLALSFSQVDDYLSCPERYRLRYVVGLPAPAHHALAYGSALHKAVAAFHTRAGAGQPMNEQELLDAFAAAWTPEGFLSRQHEETRFAAGQAALRSFREQQLVAPANVIAVERPFRFRLGGDEIVGRMDRLDGAPEGVVITDYKSADVRDQKRADKKARESLQLQVYALAHEAETGSLPARVQLHFLDSGVVGGVAPDARRLDAARVKVSAAADGIRAGRFDPAPNPVRCGYCPYRSICSASAA